MNLSVIKKHNLKKKIQNKRKKMSHFAPKDCFGCRIVSGVGVCGIGLYVAHHARNQSKAIQRNPMFLISAGVIGIGLARLFNTYPFKTKN